MTVSTGRSCAQVVGRQPALAAALTLVAAGALCSALLLFCGARSRVGALAWNLIVESNFVVFATIVLARFVCGVGIGGVYPLSSTAAFEDDDDNEYADASKSQSRGAIRAAWALFFQVPGQATVYAAALVLLGATQLTWTQRARLLLAAGSL